MTGLDGKPDFGLPLPTQPTKKALNAFEHLTKIFRQTNKAAKNDPFIFFRVILRCADFQAFRLVKNCDVTSMKVEHEH